MNNHVEEVVYILEISKTTLEGLEHLVAWVNEKKENPPFYLLEDVVSGYYSVKSSLERFVDKLPENKLMEIGSELEHELSAVFIALEAKDENVAAQLVEKFVLPAAVRWEKAIEENLSIFVKS